MKRAARWPSANQLARLVTRAPLVLSKHLWIWPLLGAVLISLVAFWTRSLVEDTVRTELISRMQTLLSANVAALRLWIGEQESDVRALAADSRVQEAVVQLTALALDPSTTRESLLNSNPSRILQQHLRPYLEPQHYLDYVVIGPDRRILASALEGEVNRTAHSGYDSFIRRALAGQTLISHPFVRETANPDAPERPTMFVASPVYSAYGDVVAVLGLRMDPEEEFSRIFSVARVGDTGEAYAFDGRGRMLSSSRFQDELKSIGLIPDHPGATAILNVHLVDPGVDLTKGEETTLPRNKMPLTRLAASATTEWDGYDVQGYRNYRGVRVVGAWAWLPEYALGVANELAADEAFQTLYVLRRVFITLFMLLGLSGVAIFAFSLIVERLEASVRKSAVATRRLGPYVLIQEIGRGSNGMVYRARHTTLRRSVAIKVLSPELTNETTAARFEHEVQMTSQLTHPNTVAIYDYGRTPEGLFYYAMEYLSGIDLDRLIREFGPVPEGRVIHILRQVCGSLAEAHRIGLIHRDIKPANIVLTRRGGVCDTVKVLDFGLVKAVNLKPKGLAANAIVGTPHFMSPESISDPEAVDARSDLYSLGAVGYWLLAGRTVFHAETVDGVLEQKVKNEPIDPAQQLGQPGGSDLWRLIMQCLAKKPDDRPASASQIMEALAKCAAARSWNATEAEKWWRANLGGLEVLPAATMPEKTLVIGKRA